jgi:predicted dinucleotide-binding enzyme
MFSRRKIILQVLLVTPESHRLLDIIAPVVIDYHPVIVGPPIETADHMQHCGNILVLRRSVEYIHAICGQKDQSKKGEFKMEIGIIGSGHIGSILAREFKKIGHQVSIANSRGPDSLRQIAAETGAIPVTTLQAAQAKDLVIISIPVAAITKLPKEVFMNSTAIIVDTGNYYPSRDGQISEIDAGLAESEWVARVLGCPVVKAFNHIVAPSLDTKRLPKGNPDRIALSVAGDNANAKQVVLGLIDKIGFDGIDGGTLAESWRQQPGTPAYCRDLKANELKSALEQANPSQKSQYRKTADDGARAHFEAQKRP